MRFDPPERVTGAEVSPPAGGAFLVEDAPASTVLTPEGLDAETRMLAEAASDFMRGVVLPAADRLEAHEADLMPSLLRQAGALGLMGLEIPEAFGGLGLAKSASARIAEAVAVEPSFAVSHNVHTSVAALPLLFFGTPEQKQATLPRLASGEWIGAYALSEAQAGTDAMASRTRAISTGDGGYILGGEKMWITNAAFADMFTVFARVEGQKGLTAFLVDRSLPGISIGREEHKLGLKGSSTCRLVLDGVPVPAENRLGEEGEGGRVALLALNLGRFKIAAGSLGQGKNLLQIATAYAKQRIAFGKPIAEFGLIQEKLARMAARLFAAESMLYRLAGYLDAAFSGIDPLSSDTNARYQAAAEAYAVECALVKVACTETLDYCADECLQIHGGYGYAEEFPAARAWRDQRVNRIYEGTNEINRLNVAQLLMKRIERGGIDLRRAPSPLEATPGSTDGLRSLLAALFRNVVEAGSRLSGMQELQGRLADLCILLFADESMMTRAAAMVEQGTSPARWESAYSARRILFAQEMGGALAAVAAIYAELDDRGGTDYALSARLLTPPPSGAISAQRELARAVLQADGYPWP